MYELLSDHSGEIHFYPVDDDDHRNASPRVHRRRRRRPRPAYRPVYHHYPAPYAPASYMPMQYAPMPYPPMPQHGQATPTSHNAPSAGLDMRSGLKALGGLLPAFGQLVGAFKSAPERPLPTGQPDKDIANLTGYVADSFERDRSSSQTTGVLATAGAVLKIIANL